MTIRSQRLMRNFKMLKLFLEQRAIFTTVNHRNNIAFKWVSSPRGLIHFQLSYFTVFVVNWENIKQRRIFTSAKKGWKNRTIVYSVGNFCSISFRSQNLCFSQRLKGDRSKKREALETVMVLRREVVKVAHLAKVP